MQSICIILYLLICTFGVGFKGSLERAFPSFLGTRPSRVTKTGMDILESVGPQLLVHDGQNIVKRSPGFYLKGKTVAFYFSAHWCVSWDEGVACPWSMPASDGPSSSLKRESRPRPDRASAALGSSSCTESRALPFAGAHPAGSSLHS